MDEFRDKVAVVTGAASGIGFGLARRFASEGMKVVMADVEEPALKSAADELESDGADVLAIVTDVSDHAAVQSLAAATFDRFGTAHIVCNNAGIGTGGLAWEVSEAKWRWIVGVNLMGVVHGIHFFVPRMLQQGRPGHIVNTASLAGLVPVAEMAPYATSKHAVVGLSESLNAELSPRGIHVSAICPGFIDTGIIASSHLQGEAATQRTKIESFYKRFGSSPEVVAEAVVDAIRHKKLIRTVPRHHVALNWALRRISPRLAQAPARMGQRLTRNR